MAEPLRHRQTKEAATDMFSLQPPRHIPTLPKPECLPNARTSALASCGHATPCALFCHVPIGDMLWFTIEELFAVCAAFALPRFTTFFDQKPNDRERAHAVNPPSSKGCLCAEADDRDHRQPPTSDRFHCISSECAAS